MRYKSGIIHVNLRRFNRIPISMQEFRSQFPALSNYVYLNTASCGLLSRDLVNWRREHDDTLLNKASEFRDQHASHIDSIRNTVARFCNAQENEVSLVPNFSFGLNTLIEGLPEGQKVLLLKNDYPSINWAFEHRDFNVCYADIDEHLEQNIEQAITEHQPDIFAFSLVQFLNGIKIDLKFLQKLKAYHPNLLLIADGTQYIGTETFSFAESPLDVLGCSAYKWLLSGYGNGFFMVKNEAQKEIFPRTIGFNSSQGKIGQRDEIPFYKRFEPGHLDTLNYGSLEQSLLFLERVGMNDISEKNKRLSRYAKKKLSELGLLEDSVMGRDEHSTIFNIKGNDALFKKLRENNIICSQRGAGIRVSFHFYNTEGDLDTLFKLL